MVKVIFQAIRNCSKGKNSLALGANSFLSEKFTILKRVVIEENH